MKDRILHFKQNAFKSTASSVKTIALISLLINFVIEILSRHSFIGAVGFIVKAPYAFVLGWMIILATMLLGLLVPKRTLTLTLVGGVWTILGIVNFIVKTYRVTPFSAVDMQKMKSVANIFTVYFNTLKIILIALGIAALITGIVFLAIKSKKVSLRGRFIKSIIVFILSWGIVAGMFFLGLKFNAVSLDMPQLTKAYDDYGFVYCFSVSVFDHGVSEPDEYTSRSTDKVLLEIDKHQKPLAKTQKPNIVYVQLESFFDVNHLKNISYTYNPVRNFEKLKRKGITGLLTVPVVGAGTVNTEFEILSGMSLDYFGAGEYPFKTVLTTNTCETIAYNLMDEGYKTHFIHDYQGSFYGRNHIYANLGFETFTSMEYMSNISYNVSGIWPKDTVLTDEIISTLDSTPEQDFIMTVAVQSHGKYPPNELPEGTNYKIGTSFDDPTLEGGPSSIDALSYYVDQIYEVDQFVGQLYDAIMAYDEPTVLVFYGDHLPSLSISNEDLKIGTTMTTEYILVSNFGIEKNTAPFGDINAYRLSAKVMAMLGMNDGIITKLHQNCSDLPNYQQWLNILEYDMLGEDNSDSLRRVYGGVYNYYPVMDMHMGIHDIAVNSMDYKMDYLYVYGEYFTPFSKLVLDGDVQADAEYVSPKLIKLKIEREKLDEKATLVVQQISGSNTVLSETPEYKIEIKRD